MAEKKINLSEYHPNDIPKAGKWRIAIVISEWNPEITFALRDGAVEMLEKQGLPKKDIIIKYAPGSFELPTAAQMMFEADTDLDAVICLGCVIQGETRHFDFICDAVAHGVMKVSLDYNSPVIFGVLTTNTLEQAKDRAGGKHGNKGVEAAVACLKMLTLERSLNK
jgi:6,7-dimethyl-8-ribityllumazine synthase